MPEIKDYYRILELEPSATLPEIKKAYRRLALKYHPDKNPDDQYALIRFSEIKEAYETLSSTGKKDLYLQERWYRQSLGKTKFNDQPLTPPVILKQLLELDKHLSTVDQFRMNKNGLNTHLLELFSDENITRLMSFDEPLVLQEIVAASLRVMKLLPQPLIEGMAARLISLCANDLALVERISAFAREQNAKNRWERLTGLLIILVTITISLLIYFVSR